MNVLLWHLHGSWTSAFVQGPHRYLLPTVPGRGPWGSGRPSACTWPAHAVDVQPERLADTDVDIVVLQRPEEIALADRWLRRTPGREVAAVYVEHDVPHEAAATSRHPMTDRDDMTLVHISPFNALMWDSGRTRTAVVEHGILDPGRRYTGELPAAATVVNEPMRHSRTAGTDLLPGLARGAPLDVFGRGTEGLGMRLGAATRIQGRGDLPQSRMHDELARRRVYLHPMRWSSLGLALIEAMQLGLPVVALATSGAAAAVPPEAGVSATDPERLADALRELVADPARARAHGAVARAHAVRRYGLPRFLRDWDAVLHQATADHRRRRPRDIRRRATHLRVVRPAVEPRR
ncbi:glycosyltransferase [Pseudonocardia bannensis]|uniref:Glycosyltransferase family 4 protein n=1 Tax=Pseudonocardia bannensis TaxID=630973 RepID=A0A848DQP5_9PSEU|nr:glycosyltransferase [Pseudonocardia bannensis]NMH95048.1 glycosyltransferase family 4 protein [Pseudonocardia bannensis]